MQGVNLVYETNQHSSMIYIIGPDYRKSLMGTNANVRCTVTVNTILELKSSSGNWERVTSWTQTNQNAYSAIISKSVTMASGYSYRVICYHYAGTDTSSSFTDGLWIRN